jgi:hypothetical protein
MVALVAVVAAAGCAGSADGSAQATPLVPPPPPGVQTITPRAAPAGSADLLLTVDGSNFDLEGHYHTVVVWVARGEFTILGGAYGTNATANRLQVTVPAALMVEPVEAQVYVQNYDLMSDAPLRVTNSVRFEVTATAEAPAGFAEAAVMSVPRSDHTATLLADGQVLIAGGDALAELFDPADAAFVPTGSLSGSASEIAAVRLRNGRVLIVGGGNPAAEIYDPATGEFALSGLMRTPRTAPTATVLADGRVLIAGGMDAISSKGKAIANAEVFDAATGSFALAESMSSARTGHDAVLLPNGRVLVVGGRNGWAPDSADDPPWDPMFAEQFDATSNTFFQAGTMHTTRVGGVGVSLPDGRVLVLGGFGDWWRNIHEQPAAPPFAEVYDDGARQFLRLATPRIVERGFTATALPDGHVLIIGGTKAGLILDAVWLLDPATGALTDAGRLTQPRTGHTATLLADGRVLVIGGVDPDGQALASAEISSRSFAE